MCDTINVLWEYFLNIIVVPEAIKNDKIVHIKITILRVKITLNRVERKTKKNICSKHKKD